MSKIKNWTLRKYVAFKDAENEEGQGLAEYGLILALVAVVCVGVLGTLSGGIQGALGSVAGHMAAA